MTNAKKFCRMVGKLMLAAIFFALTLSFTACNDSANDPTPIYKGKKIAISTDELSKYTITRSDLSGDVTRDAAIALKKALAPFSDIPLATDFVMRGDPVPEDNIEILVGQTNRADSAALTEGLRSNEFVIARTENHIVISGVDETSTAEAVSFFIANFISDKNVSCPEENYYFRCAYPVDSLSLNGVDITSYCLDTGSKVNKKLLEGLSDSIDRLTGRKLKTARNGTDSPLIRLELSDELPENTCMIAADGKNIRLVGSDTDTLIAAEKAFFTKLLKVDLTATGANLSIDIPSDPQTFDCEKISESEPIIYTVTPENFADEGSFTSIIEKVKSDFLFTLAPQVIEFTSGDYRFKDSPILLDVMSSGTRYSNLTLRAASGADVRFIGGDPIDYSNAVKVTDEAVLSRLADQSVRGKLMMLDASGLGLEAPYYNGSGSSEYTPAVYMDETPLVRSRWPNNIPGKGYLRSGETLEFEDYKTGPITFDYTDGSDHAKKFWSEETVKDLYVFGYLAWDWTNDQTKVESLDFDKKLVKLKGGLTYEPNTENRFYFYNLLEEIDLPGESFFDKDNEILYFYPYDGETKQIWVSSYADNFIKLDGASNVVIDGISFMYTCQNAISGKNISDVTIKNCTVAHSSAAAIDLNGVRITIDNCKIYDNCYGGITIQGGDRNTLTSGENVIKNCEIHDVNRSEATYKPGINAKSVGLQILNNRLWGNTHQMIEISNTNDVVIKYNEIFDCVTESSDMGAIYYGRNPTVLGIEISNNYFHDIGNLYGGVGQQAIFCDDGSIGPWVHDNIFYKATCDTAAYKGNGAQYALIENNIFLDMPMAFVHGSWVDYTTKDPRQIRWTRAFYTEHWHKMEEVDFESEIWHERYDGTMFGNVWKHFSTEVEKEVVAAKDDEAKLAEIFAKYAPEVTNVIRNNVYYNITRFSKYNSTAYGGKVTDQNNLELEKSDFTDYENHNFTLTDEALKKVRKTIPDFRNVDMSKIGPGNNG